MLIVFQIVNKCYGGLSLRLFISTETLRVFFRASLHPRQTHSSGNVVPTSCCLSTELNKCSNLADFGEIDDSASRIIEITNHKGIFYYFTLCSLAAPPFSKFIFYKFVVVFVVRIIIRCLNSIYIFRPGNRSHIWCKHPGNKRQHLRDLPIHRWHRTLSWQSRKFDAKLFWIFDWIETRVTYGQWHTDSGQFGGYRRQFVWHQLDMPGKIRKLLVGIQTWSLQTWNGHLNGSAFDLIIISVRFTHRTTNGNTLSSSGARASL